MCNLILDPLVMYLLSWGYEQDKKAEPAYGAEVLRLWAASVEPWNDMRIGQTVLKQSQEDLRKIRNTARFMLGNLGDRRLPEDTLESLADGLGIVSPFYLGFQDVTLMMG